MSKAERNALIAVCRFINGNFSKSGIHLGDLFAENQISDADYDAIENMAQEKTDEDKERGSENAD